MVNKKANKKVNSENKNYKKVKFPFWARVVFDKERSTLVIDEADVLDKKRNKYIPGFVHREATHSYKKEYEKIEPNPNPKDKRAMYLKRPKKTPKSFFVKETRYFKIPKYLIEKYSKNNK